MPSRSTSTTTATAATTWPLVPGRERLHDADDHGRQRDDDLGHRDIARGEQLAHLDGEPAGDRRPEALRAGVGRPELEAGVEGETLGVDEALHVRLLEVEHGLKILAVEGGPQPLLQLDDPRGDARPALVLVQDRGERLSQGRDAASFTVTVDSAKVVASHEACTAPMQDVHERPRRERT